jgi:hypothetical protein
MRKWIRFSNPAGQFSKPSAEEGLRPSVTVYSRLPKALQSNGEPDMNHNGPDIFRWNIFKGAWAPETLWKASQ